MRSAFFCSPALWIELWATLCWQDMLSLIHKCAYNSISMPTNTFFFFFFTFYFMSFWLFQHSVMGLSPFTKVSSWGHFTALLSLQDLEELVLENFCRNTVQRIDGQCSFPLKFSIWVKKISSLKVTSKLKWHVVVLSKEVFHRSNIHFKTAIKLFRLLYLSLKFA